LSQGYATTKDQIVVTAGVPFNVPGSTNILRVAPCDERLIFNTDRSSLPQITGGYVQ
ncbi:MAG: hypothetical protein HC814_08300, partial [Rhodobacteraceae bacterium]|nr:hypothetical protein [Paracoccaceae bacterium]